MEVALSIRVISFCCGKRFRVGSTRLSLIKNDASLSSWFSTTTKENKDASKEGSRVVFRVQ